MSVSIIATFVAIVYLGAAFLLTTPAAAQRAIRDYGADEDFQNRALDTGGYRQQRYESYPQQRSSENYGGGVLEIPDWWRKSIIRRIQRLRSAERKRALQRTVISPGCLRTGGCVRRTRSARREPDLSATGGRV